MNKNNMLLFGIICAVLCAGCGTKEEPKVIQQPVVKEEVKIVTPEQSKPVTKKIVPQKINLYTEHDDRDIPLSAVAQISGLPAGVKNIVNKQIKNADVYYVYSQKDKVVILKEMTDEAARFTRHDFEVISISIPDGKIKQETAFPVKMSNDDSETEVWKYEVFEDDMVLPSEHTSLNPDGSVNLTEKWYYGDDEVKYKLTDSEGKTVSLRKTSKSDNGNWHDEHVFYDKDGKTALNVSIVYENNHIARFTYYNPKSPETSVIMVNEYEDIDKTKETVYSSDYKLKNSYTSQYKDGKRTAIKVYDDKNNEVKEYLTE